MEEVDKKRSLAPPRLSPCGLSGVDRHCRFKRTAEKMVLDSTLGFFKGANANGLNSRSMPTNPFKAKKEKVGMRRSRSQMYSPLTIRTGDSFSTNRPQIKRLKITIPKPTSNITRANVPASYVDSSSSSRRDGECCGGQNYGVSFRRGRRRNMEDFHSAVPEMIAGKKAIGFFGVFDGHGGGRCADYSAKNLPKIVSQSIDKTPRSLFTGAFEKLDDQFLSIARSNRWNDGSTAVAALLRDCTLTVANAGDSKAVLSSCGQAVVMSRDHKPGCEEEKLRIEKKGGKVVFLRSWRVEATLAVSRAIGNRSLKAFVTSEPDVTTKSLQKGDDFLVLGTDGLWDFIKPQEAISIASEYLERDPQKLKEAAKALTDLAFDRGSMDNITALVIDLRPYQPRKS